MVTNNDNKSTLVMEYGGNRRTGPWTGKPWPYGSPPPRFHGSTVPRQVRKRDKPFANAANTRCKSPPRHRRWSIAPGASSRRQRRYKIQSPARAFKLKWQQAPNQNVAQTVRKHGVYFHVNKGPPREYKKGRQRGSFRKGEWLGKSRAASSTASSNMSHQALRPLRTRKLVAT